MITAQVGTLAGPMVGEECRREINTPYRQSFSVKFIERRVEGREGRDEEGRG